MPPRPQDPPAWPPVAPTIGRRGWALAAGAHLLAALVAVVGIAVSRELVGRDLLAFALTRVVGAVCFVAVGAVFFRALDGAGRARRRAARVALRALALVAAAAAQAALWLPIGALIDRRLGFADAPLSWPAFDLQLDINLGVYGVWALVYWALRRRLVARAALQAAARADAALRAARLHALALELQPHFLFNTLNGITQLVHEAPDVAERMLVTLADLLRLTLAGGSAPELPLAEELRRLALYLDLQRMRFGDRLTVRVEVDAALAAARVPAMLLQPLVENALSHGIGARPGPGTLVVRADRIAGADASASAPAVLRLVVRDDGVGLGADAPAREGTGLRNTRERLATLHPGAHRFAVRPAPGGGAEAVVELPLDLRPVAAPIRSEASARAPQPRATDAVPPATRTADPRVAALR